jgi:A/G-specific adenine glycosylase
MQVPDETDEARIARIREGLFAWFQEHARDLPWRRTRDPYAILVSEVMLQQTQVDRVLPYYARFLERFPTVEDLANAATSDVIRIWSGLGYNRRAVNLQRAARAVVDELGGTFPVDPADL